MTPQMFEVVVRGVMGPELSSALENLFVVESTGDGLTRVVGDIRDPAAASRVVGRGFGVRIEVVSVNPLDAGRDE